MTEDDLKAFLESNKTEIQAAVKQKMIDSLLAEHRWDMSEAIGKVVREFIDTEIVPGVKVHLGELKGPIMAAAIQSAATIGDMLSKGMVEHAAKKLAPGSYDYKKIMDAMFGGY